GRVVAVPDVGSCQRLQTPDRIRRDDGRRGTHPRKPTAGRRDVDGTSRVACADACRRATGTVGIARGDDMTTNDTRDGITLERAYPVGTLEESGDGRTIYGRCVPYDVEATVADRDVSGHYGTPYVEVCRPGMFRHALRAAHRAVLLNWQHLEDLSNQIARGV